MAIMYDDIKLGDRYATLDQISDYTGLSRQEIVDRVNDEPKKVEWEDVDPCDYDPSSDYFDCRNNFAGCRYEDNEDEENEDADNADEDVEYVCDEKCLDCDCCEFDYDRAIKELNEEIEEESCGFWDYCPYFDKDIFVFWRCEFEESEHFTDDKINEDKRRRKYISEKYDEIVQREYNGDFDLVENSYHNAVVEAAEAEVEAEEAELEINY